MTKLLLPTLAALLIASAALTVAPCEVAPHAATAVVASGTGHAGGTGDAHHAVKRGADDAAGDTRQGRGADDPAGDDNGGNGKKKGKKKGQKNGKKSKDDKGAHHGANHK